MFSNVVHPNHSTFHNFHNFTLPATILSFSYLFFVEADVNAKISTDGGNEDGDYDDYNDDEDIGKIIAVDDEEAGEAENYAGDKDELNSFNNSVLL
ncbi:hypothetical protein ElyMa_001784600 [Elysia marginata]|uniref:Uncharacterized protein n=1 Tax=Elysia marginata TaxID=1093978 RepID=A0AAV4EEI3_9GAST|nr:hypothetical protein ElyMa_001784600 [Elysia marginata]